MYYPQAPKEPSGCVQTIMITKAILGILAVPVGLIFLLMLFVLTGFVALSIHPALALLVAAVAASLIAVAIRWERKRVERDFPKIDD
jgi:hypothetical protein